MQSPQPPRWGSYAAGIAFSTAGWINRLDKCLGSKRNGKQNRDHEISPSCRFRFSIAYPTRAGHYLRSCSPKELWAHPACFEFHSISRNSSWMIREVSELPPCCVNVFCGVLLPSSLVFRHLDLCQAMRGCHRFLLRPMRSDMEPTTGAKIIWVRLKTSARSPPSPGEGPGKILESSPKIKWMILVDHHLSYPNGPNGDFSANSGLFLDEVKWSDELKGLISSVPWSGDPSRRIKDHKPLALRIPAPFSDQKDLWQIQLMQKLTIGDSKPVMMYVLSLIILQFASPQKSQ